MAAPNPLLSRPLWGGTTDPSRFTPAVNSTYNSRYRTLPISQIMAQRENKTGAYDTATGQATPRGTRLFAQGWDTSGVGPGTRGYTGSWRPGGYNFGEGTGRPSAKTSDEFYAQRDEIAGNPLDNLELGNSNLMGSFLKNAIAEARGQQAGTAQDPFAGRTTYGAGGPASQQQTVTTALGEIPIGAQTSQPPDAAQIQQMIADARRQETMDMLAARQIQNTGLVQPQQTTAGATIEGMPSDLYFQYKAQESGQPNRFATDPYAGGDSSEAWQYQQRLAPFLKRLGIGQPFPSRRPL